MSERKRYAKRMVRYMQGVKHGLREGKLPLLKILCVGFFAGIILTNIGKSIWIENTGLLDENTLYQMKYMTVDRNALFYYVLKERLGSVLVLVILSTTYLGLAVCGLAVFWYGMGAGILMAIAVIRYGIKGILLVVAAFFPHFPVYIPGMIMVLIWCQSIYRCIYLERRGGNRSFETMQVTKRLLWMIAIFLLMIIGCMLEGYVNPYILQGMLRNF